MSPTEARSVKLRVFTGRIILFLALLLLMAGWMIPFKYESFSILYKFGMEKIYLRSGKMAGITIALLIYYQLLLASRFTVLAQVFSIKKLLNLHRLNGIVITVLVVVHPLLIKASENFTPYTFNKKYYPEFIGIGLLGILLMLSFTTIFRKLVKTPYKKWLLWHRIGVTLIVFIMPAHILYVSETFKSGLPRQAALIVFGLNLLMLSRVWLLRLLKKAL